MLSESRTHWGDHPILDSVGSLFGIGTIDLKMAGGHWWLAIVAPILFTWWCWGFEYTFCLWDRCMVKVLLWLWI